jgi:hypothetical protein
VTDAPSALGSGTGSVALDPGVPPLPPSASSPRLPWRTAMGGAFVVTLLRPASWAVGLAGFLAGGGVLLVGLPIAVLPTPSGLQNALGGPVSTLVVGTPSATLIALIVLVVAGAVVALVGGTIAGAWAERAGIALTLGSAEEERLFVAPDLRGAPGTGRTAGVRLLSLVPVAVVVGLAWQSVYDATYQELILPRDLVTPLPVRVIGGVPGPLAAILLTWLVSDSAAALGVRRLVLGRRPMLVAWGLGWFDLVRHPLRSTATAMVGLVVLVALLGPAMLAASAGWASVREVLLGDRDAFTVLLAVALWVAIWLGALVLAGLAAAVRVAAWTLIADRPG